jgi:ferredoxin
MILMYSLTLQEIHTNMHTMAVKKKIKIIYDREACIGAAACAVVAPKYWKIASDGKADLLNGKKNKKTGKWELEVEVDEDEAKKIKESAISCPVQVIIIED